MEINSRNQENVGVFTKWWNNVKDIPRKFKKKIEKIGKNVKQIGEDDPRKIWHAFKVGLALTLVSLFYYNEPLFHSFDEPVMWAILTVVVTFEFTVGGTISKCINRGIGTIVAGAFGLGAKYLAQLIGKNEPSPIVLGVCVFIVGVLGTFTRFYPHIKRRYDYGTMVFVLTFSLVAISGYRSENILQLARRRIFTIFIGIYTVMIISIVIRPVWAGEDLHKLVSINLEKLASFLEGFKSEYFHKSEISVEGTKNNEKRFIEAFLSVLCSKANEESLANLAWWEPPHGNFKFNYPWKQYLKIGGLIRKCACHLLALNSHLNSKPKASIEFESRTEEACKRMITESSKDLKELALSIRTMTQPISSIIHIRNTENVIDDLKHTLDTSKTFFPHNESRVMDFIDAASIVSLLVAISKCVDEIAKAIEELSSKARFEEKETRKDSCSTEKPQIRDRGTVNPVMEDEMKEGDFVTIDLDDNVETAKKVIAEEANRVNINPINATKGEPFFIWIRGGTTTEIVEETKTPKKKGEFMDLANIKFYYNSTQFFESAERLAVLEEANQVNNPLTPRKEESIVTRICEDIKTAEKN
ncbi:putative aluminum-activated malate transporter 8-like [Capsicum annuum]|nr:putative aluminum-activated malate transporter 8-like [Capsicum annuum]